MFVKVVLTPNIKTTYLIKHIINMNELLSEEEKETNNIINMVQLLYIEYM